MSKILAFTQMRNELSKGNLLNWLKCVSVCDYFAIADNASDDGSIEYVKQFFKDNCDNLLIKENKTNRFFEELIVKEELLREALQKFPDVTHIWWQDVDLLMPAQLWNENGKGLRELCEQNFDSFIFGHWNLWYSDNFYRLDMSYNNLDGHWCCLWRNNGNLFFPKLRGLHKSQVPLGLTSQKYRKGIKMIHKGFSKADNIIGKYLNYKSLGQRGYDLDRLIDETTLDVREVPPEYFPSFYKPEDTINPLQKKRIVDIMVERGIEI